MSKTVPFQTIPFSISTQFKYKNNKLSKPQFSSIWPIDRNLIRDYNSGPEWTWERWQWRDTLLLPKLQQYWNLTFRLFSVISTTHVGGSYHSTEMQSVYFTAPADQVKTLFKEREKYALKVRITTEVVWTTSKCLRDSSPFFPLHLGSSPATMSRREFHFKIILLYSSLHFSEDATHDAYLELMDTFPSCPTASWNSIFHLQDQLPC